MRNLAILSGLGRRSLSNSGLRRFFSTQSSPCVLEETINVPVGSNGSLSLDICSSIKAIASPPRHSVLLYLPPGPLPVQWVETSLYDRLRHRLAQSERPWTLATLKYRLEPPTHLFPTPVHDALAGLDWIIQNLCQLKNEASSPELELQPQISIYGSFLGATLGMGLAMTEPKYVHSVNLVNPIIDWVSVDDQPFCASTDGRELLGIRKKLFRRAEDYFDPFASPAFFLRAPNRDVPVDRAAPSSGIDEELEVTTVEGSIPSVKRRKALRHFPPANSTLRDEWSVPLMNFWVTGDGKGRQDIFRAQAEDMVRLLRRNYLMTYKGSVNDEEARTRINLQLVPEIGDVDLP